MMTISEVTAISMAQKPEQKRSVDFNCRVTKPINNVPVSLWNVCSSVFCQSNVTAKISQSTSYERTLQLQSLTLTWIKAASIFLLFNLFWKKDVFDTGVRLRLNQSKLYLYLCYICLYVTLDNFLSIHKLGLVFWVNIYFISCVNKLVVSVMLFKNVLRLLYRSMLPMPTLANSAAQGECTCRAKQCWGLNTNSGEFTLA